MSPKRSGNSDRQRVTSPKRRRREERTSLAEGTTGRPRKGDAGLGGSPRQRRQESRRGTDYDNDSYAKSEDLPEELDFEVHRGGVDEFFAEEDGDEALDGGHDDLDYEDDFNERDFRVDHLA